MLYTNLSYKGKKETNRGTEQIFPNNLQQGDSFKMPDYLPRPDSVLIQARGLRNILFASELVVYFGIGNIIFMHQRLSISVAE